MQHLPEMGLKSLQNFRQLHAQQELQFGSIW